MFVIGLHQILRLSAPACLRQGCQLRHIRKIQNDSLKKEGKFIDNSEIRNTNKLLSWVGSDKPDLSHE
jgi:hypothetical protein